MLFSQSVSSASMSNVWGIPFFVAGVNTKVTKSETQGHKESISQILRDLSSTFVTSVFALGFRVSAQDATEFRSRMTAELALPPWRPHGQRRQAAASC